MAARKKVTKRASNAPVRGGSVRQKRTTKRGQAAESKAGANSKASANSKARAKSDGSKASRRTALAESAGAADVSSMISATSSKKGVRPAAPSVVDAATAPRKAVGAGVVGPTVGSEAKASRGAVLRSKDATRLMGADGPEDIISDKGINRRSFKGANPAPARSHSVAAAHVVETAAKAPAAVAAGKPAAGAAVAAVSQETAKTTKAPAPAKTIDREPSGGEQKTMKNSAIKHGFKLNEFVVYPAHGVGQIVAMEEQEVAGFKLELFVINFVKDKMTLRVPTSKVAGVGMRKLSDPDAARRSLDILTGRARVKRTMWSRRAQEYEAKINSGDINAIAEVVRDLYRSEAQPEQSYSERQLYEAALDRMMREIAAVQKLSETEALKVIDTQLKKNQKRGVKADAGEGDEAGIEEAA